MGRWQWVVATAWLLTANQAQAFNSYLSDVPNTDVYSCLTCHNNPSGGSGCGGGTGYPTGPYGSCRNVFGYDFGRTFSGHTSHTWDSALRDRDSDGDGRTNGQELVYFGSSFPGSSQGSNTYVTRPGAATGSNSRHTNECVLQASGTFGYTYHPRNYTNCSTNSATNCTNNSSSSANPSGSRYWGFTCSCDSGYTGNGRRDVASDGVSDPGASGCTDINECASPTRCRQDFPVNNCINLGGTYDCTCGAGWTETGTGNSRTCSDNNECASATRCNAHLNYGTCSNTLGAYDCNCNSGFTVQNNGTFSETCVDINECASPTTCNEHLGYGTCSNNIGGYTCSCAPGFGFNGVTCVVDNECTTGMDDCDANATCIDTPSSYDCMCNPGYTGDGHTRGTGCNNINECIDLRTCARNVSSVNKCTDISGSYICTCGAGFEVQGSGLSATCVDINECVVDPGICGPGTCSNRVGSYTCSCNAGYEFRNGTCEDIDECANPSTCGSARAGCTNLAGTYSCSCDQGYGAPPTGGSCTDIDECASGNPCDPGTCANEVGSYTCTCPTGYRAEGGACVDIDECETLPCGPGTCSEGTPGNYSCACDSGYEETAPLNGTCIDIDECMRPELSLCSSDATCANSPGSFTCTCNTGYEGDGQTCSDVDECADSALNECSPNADCINEVGTYQCDCRDGFSGSGVTCFDVDECVSANPCDRVTERCVNLVGDAPRCECALGYSRPDEESPCTSACGNGERLPGEHCDDGNVEDGDGCSSLCEVESGWACFDDVATGGSRCENTCGDGLVQASEECDDAEANSDTEPDACRERCVQAHCGDGVVDTGEDCDDGEANSDESAGACRTSCRAPYCGDGVRDDGEMCDPGGDAALDPSRCTACTLDGGIAGDASVSDPDDDSGCGCHLVGRSNRTPAGLLLVLLGLLGVGLRRRRQ